VLLWGATGTFDFAKLFGMAAQNTLPTAGLGLTMLLIYMGAVGKSAQFPLHVWLPDAMEGPTPVSALIHAATMVTAGVFLVVRAMPLFVLTPDVLTLIGWIGAFTALLAATMACVESDIKRVLAYSTVSQLGYMMAAAGANAAAAGFFHLLTHGVFKALLFLAAGAVIHAVGTNDLFRMGGLRRAMPQTATTFIIGTLALAGVWPFAGFFSKEEILAGVWAGSMIVPFAMLALTAFLTAFYMFRVVFLAFFGQPHPGAHPHEAPPLMVIPLWILAALTTVIGLRLAFRGAAAEHHGPPWLALFSLTLAGSGLLLAWVLYQRRLVAPERVAAVFPLNVLDVLARHRYGIDALYAGLYQGFILGLSRLVGWIDRYVVDGLVNLGSAWTLRGGDQLRRIQSGRAQDYVYGVAFGVLLLFVWAQWLRR
jgi:NADH-quinone oxidoreductase subunit L